jgi:hypothetical protein
MSDIINKTNEYIIPTKKHANMLYPKTDIFNRNTQDELKTGKRLISIESIRNNGSYSGLRYKQMDEVHFSNINNEK